MRRLGCSERPPCAQAARTRARRAQLRPHLLLSGRQTIILAALAAGAALTALADEAMRHEAALFIVRAIVLDGWWVEETKKLLRELL